MGAETAGTAFDGTAEELNRALDLMFQAGLTDDQAGYDAASAQVRSLLAEQSAEAAPIQ